MKVHTSLSEVLVSNVNLHPYTAGGDKDLRKADKHYERAADILG